MLGHGSLRLTDPDLRHAAFSVEQVAAGHIDGPECGAVREEDIREATAFLERLGGRPGPIDRKRAAAKLLESANHLHGLMAETGATALIYLDEAEYELEPRLRAGAIEIDFCFGDHDGRISPSDLQAARRQYGNVRGPVGWNRLLMTDELEGLLFPHRTLPSIHGLRLLPRDWLTEGTDPVRRLKKSTRYLDDAALARTYADVAARLAAHAFGGAPASHDVFEQALSILGAEIQRRDSIRPTITDIARVGCEDPDIKAVLCSPIEMSRRLSPAALLDRFLDTQAPLAHSA